MTMTMEMPDRSSRWLLIGSLALNLFFVGTVGALALRHIMAPPQSVEAERPRTAAAGDRWTVTCGRHVGPTINHAQHSSQGA